jgi:putative zinc finger protein
MSHVDDGALHAYLDGELLPVERAQLEAHVAECPACRTRLEEERALVARAGQLLSLAQPVERPAPPMHQLRRPRLAWRLQVPLAWAASVALAVGLGYYLGNGSDAAAPRTLAATQRVRLDSPPGLVSGYDGLQRVQERAVPPSPPPEARPERRAANQVAALRDERADSAVAKAAPESPNLVAGVVASEAQGALRPVTPTPVPGATVATSRPSADLSAERGRLVATQWPIIRPGPARELLGADPVGVPGLAVRNIRRSPAGDVVLVEQTLDSATVIQVFQERVEDDRAMLFQERAAEPRSAAPPAPARQRSLGTERLARFIGRLRVEIAGPLSADSLNRLLEQLKPIP